MTAEHSLRCWVRGVQNRCNTRVPTVPTSESLLHDGFPFTYRLYARCLQVGVQHDAHEFCERNPGLPV